MSALAKVWREQAGQLQQSDAYRAFLERLQRELAIETGIIERLYTIDRGITLTLIEHGIDAVLIPHDATDKPVSRVVAIIKDQQQAVEGVFDFVKQQRPLTNTYIRELHQILTAHQDLVDAVDTLGRRVEAPLLRGQWKKLPNNPSRTDGWLHEYCPPEHVQSEMDRLIDTHRDHMQAGVPPEVEAAWLHHRFTQIHPFQDGNGRVARCLANLVFLRAGWFPLLVTRDDLVAYIRALEAADQGDLAPLVDLFAARQRRAFVQGLSISHDVLRERAHEKEIVESATRILERRRREYQSRVYQTAQALHQVTVERFQQTATEVRGSVQRVDRSYDARESHAEHGAATDSWHRFQIVGCARALGYFANMSSYRSWVLLVIKTEDRAEILLSFHGIGREALGVLGCSAMAYRREPTDSGHTRVDQLQPLSEEIFEFTYVELVEDVKKRFARWLDAVLISGLSFWQRGL